MIKLYFSDEISAMSLDTRVRALAIGQNLCIFPESGLHPSNHTDITENLLKLYRGNTDVYVATHSELVILRAMRMIREGRATNKEFRT